MIRNSLKINYIILSVAICLCLSSCAKGTENNAISETSGSKVSEAEASASEALETADNSANTLSSEEDYRSAISAATSAEDKASLYDRFSSCYTLSESEYIDYADICASLGYTKKQRNVLWTLYRLDPSREHGELISERCMYLDESDSAAIELIAQLKEMLDRIGTDDFNISDVTTLVNSDSWSSLFYLDSGIYTSHTGYIGNGYEAHIYSGKVNTETIINETERKLSIYTDTFGSTAKVCGLNGESCEGDFAVIDYNAGGEVTSKKIGTVRNGHCVGALTIVMDGITFTGQFDDNGITTEAQQDTVDGVVYAYDESKSKYLYVDGADPANWTADEEFIGL